jgi:hypothetical protein
VQNSDAVFEPSLVSRMSVFVDVKHSSDAIRTRTGEIDENLG